MWPQRESYVGRGSGWRGDLWARSKACSASWRWGARASTCDSPTESCLNRPGCSGVSVPSSSSSPPIRAMTLGCLPESSQSANCHTIMLTPKARTFNARLPSVNAGAPGAEATGTGIRRGRWRHRRACCGCHWPGAPGPPIGVLGTLDHASSATHRVRRHALSRLRSVRRRIAPPRPSGHSVGTSASMRWRECRGARN